jgi:hypothetical protein
MPSLAAWKITFAASAGIAEPLRRLRQADIAMASSPAYGWVVVGDVRAHECPANSVATPGATHLARVPKLAGSWFSASVKPTTTSFGAW